MMDGGEVVAGNDDDLDSFFRDKDRRKQERLARKMAAKQELMQMQPPTSAWMVPDEEHLENNAKVDEPQVAANEDTTEDIANRLQQQSLPPHRPEDDEWIDTEKEFAPTSHHGKRGKARAALAQQEDDKLLLLVAPGARNLKDLSSIPSDKLKSKNAGAATTGRSWSKISAVEAEPIAQQTEAPKPEEPVPVVAPAVVPTENDKVEAETKVEEPVPAKEASEGLYVPRHKRTDAVAPSSPAAGRSPRTQSPVSKPAGSAVSSGPAASAAPVDSNAYIPPSLRAKMQQQQAPPPPPSSGPSRPAGSGLAAFSQPKQAAAAAKKIAPDLKSADEFPSLG